MFPKQIQDRLDKGSHCWSSIDDGWIPLIVELDEKLSKNDPDYVIDQIKEKFGGLRFYASGLNHEDAFDLITIAENESYTTCEMCGKGGHMVSIRGWVKTYCEEHYIEMLDKANKR